MQQTAVPVLVNFISEYLIIYLNNYLPDFFICIPSYLIIYLSSCCMQQTVVPVLVNCKDRNIKVLSEGNIYFKNLRMNNNVIVQISTVS